MSILNLDILSAKVGDSNPSSNYMPVRTNNNASDWQSISALFIGFALGLELKGYGVENFEVDCRIVFEEKLSGGSFWQVLRKAYFEKNDILMVAPQCLLLNANTEQTKAADQRVARVLRNLLGNMNLVFDVDDHLNFIERTFLNVLIDKCKKTTFTQVDESYLPFISKYFQQDMDFLATHPKYLLEQLPEFLSLYTFLYTSQLALNLPEWSSGEPEAKPLYFILDTEKASSERMDIKNFGWESFKDSAASIFPLLSMLEVLQLEGQPKKTLWQIYSELQNCPDKSSYIEALKAYALRFRDERGLGKRSIPFDDETVFTWFDFLLQLGKDQFDVNLAGTSTRYQANNKVVGSIIEYIAADFVQNRRRSGNVLVLNQDYLLLLTNLAIGTKEKLRLAELIESFRARGVYFDKQTQQKIVGFYERIGNVERMSDSGEAIYVHKTV